MFQVILLNSHSWSVATFLSAPNNPYLQSVVVFAIGVRSCIISHNIHKAAFLGDLYSIKGLFKFNMAQPRYIHKMSCVWVRTRTRIGTTMACPFGYNLSSSGF